MDGRSADRMLDVRLASTAEFDEMYDARGEPRPPYVSLAATLRYGWWLMSLHNPSATSFGYVSTNRIMALN